MKTKGGRSGPARRREESLLLQALSPDIQRRHMNALNRFGISAVVVVKAGVCTGCHMRQPAVPNELENDIHECQHCGRLMYDPDDAYALSVG